METRRMCPHCRAFIKTSDHICPYCDTKVGPRAIERREPGLILGGLISHAQFTTSVILLLNFGLFAATVVYSMNSGNPNALMDVDGRTLVVFGAKWFRGIVQYGEWWRLVTAGFLHGGAMHILMNSWVLFDLGAQVEEAYGSARFIVIYFLSTIGGFYASLVWSASLSVGASAGLFGLIGAMIALGVRYRSPMGDAIRSHYLRWAMYGLAIGVLGVFFDMRMDNAAHIGGLITGFAVAYVAGTPKLTFNWGERLWRGAAGISIALTAFSFFEMYRWFAEVSR